MAGEIQLNGTSFASESGGTITINNGTLGSSVVFPAGFLQKYAQYALFYVNANGGTATSVSWQTYPLNTEIDNSDSLVTSFSSNQVTVPAGTYLFFLRAAFYLTNGSNIRLYNVTGAAAVGNEFNMYASAAGIISGCVKATFSVSTTVRMEYYTESTNADDGLGIDRGVNQQYGDLTIFQIT